MLKDDEVYLSSLIDDYGLRHVLNVIASYVDACRLCGDPVVYDTTVPGNFTLDADSLRVAADNLRNSAF